MGAAWPTAAGAMPALAAGLAFAAHAPGRSRTLTAGKVWLAALAWSGLSAEGLSALGALTPAGSAAAWLLFALGAGVLRLATDRAARRRAPRWPREALALTAVVAAALGATALTALAAAPNNWDGLVYHLPRAAQWAARGSVAFYETGISRQLSQPPAAEYAILHTMLLSGGDRWAAAVQWIAGLAALAAVWRLGGRLRGAGVPALRAKAWAAFTAATLPMFVLQASSTQNDLVLSATLLWAAVFALRDLDAAPAANPPPGCRPARRRGGDLGWFALALALAWWTKGTAWIYGPVLLAGWALAAWRRGGWGAGAFGRTATRGLAVLAAAALLQAPHALRNQRHFGQALGPDYALANERPGAGAAWANGWRNAAWLLRTGHEAWDGPLQDLAERALASAGQRPDDPATTWPWTPPFDLERPLDPSGRPLPLYQEDVAPAAPWVLLLLLAALATVRSKNPRARAWAAGLLLAFVFFSAALRWQVWHPRLLLPWLLAGAALAGPWLAARAAPWRVLAAGLLLGLSAPLWWGTPHRAWTGPEGIFARPRDHGFFAARANAEAPFRAVAEALRTEPADAAPAALLLSGDAWEYPLWALARPAALPSAVPAEDGTLRLGAPPPPLLLVWPDAFAGQAELTLDGTRYTRERPARDGAPALYRRLRPAR